MKVNMPLAQSAKKSPHDLSFPVIQTLGINDTRCVGAIQCEQGDRVHISLNQFSRFSPLVVPTFGDFKIKTHAFWVPTRLVWKHYLEYMNDSLDASFDNMKLPVNFSLEDLFTAFTTGGFVSQQATWSTQNDGYSKDAVTGKPTYDLNIWDAENGTGVSYNYSAYGRLIFSSLQALGYAIPFYIMMSDNVGTGDIYKTYYDYWKTARYSMYPLLSFLRVFYDWIYPSQYVTQQGLGMFFLDDFSKHWNFGSLAQHALDLREMFRLMYNPYDKSFWTSLWALPNQVAKNTAGGRGQSQIGTIFSEKYLNGNSLLDISSNTYNSSAPSPAVIQGSASVTGSLTANALHWLTSLSDYVLRNNIGGTRVREYLKSHFGFTPSDVQSDVSTWIRTFTDHVAVQDVTNMASSASNILGEQGGKAYSSGNGSIKFEASERGMIIFVTQVVPAVGYYQGVAKECRKIGSRFDLYLPDFDSVTMEAIPREAIFAQYRDAVDTTKVGLNTLGDVLGYAPRDAERKIHRAILSGDFLFNSRNTGLESYHTYRDVLYGRNNLAIDANFLEADNQTQRIFAFTGEQVNQGYAQYDKIFNQMYFNVTKYSMMKSLSASLPFFDEDGNRVNVEYEGQNI